MSSLNLDDDDVPEGDRAKFRCHGRTAKGTRCSRAAIHGHRYCKVHAFRVPTRPGKLTPDLRDRIVAAVAAGAYLDTAAQAHGVSRQTLHRWMQRGDDAEARAAEHRPDDDLSGATIWDYIDPQDWPYVEFRDALKAAEAFREIELMQLVAVPHHTAWQAYMTMLERRFPQRWRRRDTRSVEVAGEVAQTVRLHVPTDEEREQVLRALQESGAVDVDPADGRG